MIFYILLFFVSFGGALYIIFQHKHELEERYEIFSAEHPSNFAHFMSDISTELHGMWDVHMRDQILLLVEKRLRRFRIIVLRVEHLLFRATHHVRNASNRNDTPTNDAQNASIEENTEIK